MTNFPCPCQMAFLTNLLVSLPGHSSGQLQHQYPPHVGTENLFSEPKKPKILTFRGYSLKVPFVYFFNYALAFVNKVIHHFCISFMKFCECGSVASFILRMTFYPPVSTALCVRFIRNSLFRVTWNGMATCNLQPLAIVFGKDCRQDWFRYTIDYAFGSGVGSPDRNQNFKYDAWLQASGVALCSCHGIASSSWQYRFPCGLLTAFCQSAKAVFPPNVLLLLLSHFIWIYARYAEPKTNPIPCKSYAIGFIGISERNFRKPPGRRSQAYQMVGVFK